VQEGPCGSTTAGIGLGGGDDNSLLFQVKVLAQD
jgi:hypothetical protein